MCATSAGACRLMCALNHDLNSHFSTLYCGKAQFLFLVFKRLPRPNHGTFPSFFLSLLCQHFAKSLVQHCGMPACVNRMTAKFNAHDLLKYPHNSPGAMNLALLSVGEREKSTQAKSMPPCVAPHGFVLLSVHIWYFCLSADGFKNKSST